MRLFGTDVTVGARKEVVAPIGCVEMKFYQKPPFPKYALGHPALEYQHLQAASYQDHSKNKRMPSQDANFVSERLV